MKINTFTIVPLAALWIMGSLGTAKAQCRACVLNGPSQGLVGEALSFTTPIQANAQYIWSVTGNLNVSGRQAVNRISILNTAPATGKVCVGRFVSGQEPCTTCKPVSIATCLAPSRVSISQVSENCFSVVFRARPNRDGPGSYRWTRTGNGFIEGPDNTEEVRVTSVSINPDFGARVVFTPDCQQQPLSQSRTAVLADGCRALASRPRLFPNPSGNALTLSFPQSTHNLVAAFEATIYDQRGNTLLRERVGLGTQTIDIRHLPRGEYYLKVSQQGKAISTQRFMKQ